jgi:hypothetical protein
LGDARQRWFLCTLSPEPTWSECLRRGSRRLRRPGACAPGDTPRRRLSASTVACDGRAAALPRPSDRSGTSGSRASSADPTRAGRARCPGRHIKSRPGAQRNAGPGTPAPRALGRLCPCARLEPVGGLNVRLWCPSFKLRPRSSCKIKAGQRPSDCSASPVRRSKTGPSARAAASQRHPPSLDGCGHTRPQPGPGTPIRSLTRSRPALAPAPALRAPARGLPPWPASPALFPPCHRGIERPSSRSRPTR